MKKISGRHKRFFKIAKKASVSSEMLHKHGSVLVKGGSIIKIGYNSRTFSKVANILSCDSIAMVKCRKHAEIVAISYISREVIQSSVLYVCRVRSNNDLAFSKPCPMCTSVLKRLGVKRIYYTIDKQHYGELKL